MNREAQIDSEIKKLQAERESLRKNRFWCCPSCKRKTKIKDLDLIRYMYYDIEDWRYSGMYGITCPKCKKLVNGYKDHKQWTSVYELAHYFKTEKSQEQRRGLL